MIVNYEAAKDIKTLGDLSESFYQISLLIDDIFMACCNNNIDISKYEQDMRESYYLAKNVASRTRCR